jgi:hypothetical protein
MGEAGEVEPSQPIPALEVERMMKLQDVLLKAMANKLNWVAAAEIIGVTPRTMRCWRARLQEDGYSGLRDGRKGKPSFRRVRRFELARAAIGADQGAAGDLAEFSNDEEELRSRGAGSHAEATLHAEPIVDDVLPTKLLLLAELRKRMGRGGPRTIRQRQTPAG